MCNPYEYLVIRFTFVKHWYLKIYLLITLMEYIFLSNNLDAQSDISD